MTFEEWYETEQHYQGFAGSYDGAKRAWLASRKVIEADLAAANARAEQNEQDAARYRWLRVNSTQPAEGWSTHINPESLDAAIDAAIAAREKP